MIPKGNQKPQIHKRRTMQNGQMKKKEIKSQTMVDKTLIRKPKIDHIEPH
jgi:hypothetical protein